MQKKDKTITGTTTTKDNRKIKMISSDSSHPNQNSLYPYELTLFKMSKINVIKKPSKFKHRLGWVVFMVACLCHFVISFFRLFAWRYGAAPRRNNAKRKDEITKKRQAK